MAGSPRGGPGSLFAPPLTLGHHSPRPASHTLPGSALSPKPSLPCPALLCSSTGCPHSTVTRTILPPPPSIILLEHPPPRRRRSTSSSPRHPSPLAQSCHSLTLQYQFPPFLQQHPFAPALPVRPLAAPDLITSDRTIAFHNTLLPPSLLSSLLQLSHAHFPPHSTLQTLSISPIPSSPPSSFLTPSPSPLDLITLSSPSPPLPFPPFPPSSLSNPFHPGRSHALLASRNVRLPTRLH